jgi:hypothetical protein
MTKLAFVTAATAAALSMAAAAPASATIILGVGAGVLQPDENLLFNNNPTPGLTIEGVTNKSGTLVAATGGETLKASGGQARLDTSDGKISSFFTFNGFANQLVGFDLSDSAKAFTETEFRIFGGTATQVTLTFVDTAGEVFQQTFGVPANGFFNARAIDGQQIDYFSIAANGTIGDIRQIRIGGIGDLVGVVPEPATWAMMLMGFGAAGAMLRTRRRVLAASA